MTAGNKIHEPLQCLTPQILLTFFLKRQTGVYPGVGLMARVVSLGSLGPEFKSRLPVELIPGGVDSACHPSEIGKMSASMLISFVGVATRPVLCPIAQETA